MSAPMWIEALSATLLHSLWQGVLIGLAVAGAKHLLREQRPQLRYGAACLGMLSLLPVSAVTFWSEYQGLQAAHATEASLASLLLHSDLPVAPLAAQAAPGSAFGLPSWPMLVAAAWLVGVALMSVRLLGGAVRLRRLVRHATEPLVEPWTTTSKRLVDRAGIRSAVRFARTERITAPVVIGWLRPVVLMPAAVLMNLPRALVEALLIHELCHIRRHDALMNLCASVLETLFFYHPVAWWLGRSIREEREYCCDDDAQRVLGGPKTTYARALTELEALRVDAPDGFALSAGGSSLKTRVRRLIAPQGCAHSTPSRWLAPLLVLGALALALAPTMSACAASSDDGLDSSAPTELSEPLDAPWLPPALKRWERQIMAAAEAHDVDPNLLAIVVLIESGGFAEAQSPMGARGLMQIMPATAEHIAEQRGINDYSADKLSDPQLNLDFGAWYLAQQLRRFSEQADSDTRAIELAAAAYNGGPKRAAAYAQGKQELSEETRRYVKLVNAMWKERNQPSSATYSAWQQRILERSSRRAERPLDGGEVTLAFGPQTHPISKQAFHHDGIDLGLPQGSPVRSPLAGVVEQAVAEPEDARGRLVILRHGAALETRYYHLHDVWVEVGQKVRKGEILGEVGSSGVSTGPHLHFEVRAHGRPVDPAKWGELLAR